MPRPLQQQLPSTARAELEDEAINKGGDGDEVMQEEVEQEGYASSTPTSSLTWISWFCSLPGHEYFCEVSEEFLEDEFNLTGLNSMVPFWKEAMDMVLDVEPEEDSLKIPDVSIIEASAELSYGLVHQRYILSRPGLHAMAEKYEAGQFGTCPRVYCLSCHVVPCGRSDLPGLDTVKLYCPNCSDIFTPPSSKFQGVDGAFFGTTFAHLFFQSYREFAPVSYYVPSESSSVVSRSPRSSTQPAFVDPNPYGGQKPAAGKVYTPKIYGFRVSERAKSGPRMRWLRLRPQNPAELDQVDWRGRWIGSDDEYEDEEEDEDVGQMEDFDPDAVGEDEEEEEEEEEEEDNATSGPPTVVPQSRKNQLGQADFTLRPPTPINAPPPSSSPRGSFQGSSTTGLRTPRDEPAPVSSLPPTLLGKAGVKVKAVRTVASESWARAMQV